jgi:hypothetical protein
MTTNQESIYWKTNKEWYKINEHGKYELTEKATERAKASFDLYTKKRK